MNLRGTFELIQKNQPSSLWVYITLGEYRNLTQ
jgi:hypothetical protein